MVRLSFKPYYNWNAFNTNLSLNYLKIILSFKPYYNWNAFNTNLEKFNQEDMTWVLNLIITGMPSILLEKLMSTVRISVLNLIITGMPSILKN